MPISKHWIPEFPLSQLIDDVDIEIPAWRLIAHIEENVGKNSLWVKVGQA